MRMLEYMASFLIVNTSNCVHILASENFYVYVGISNYTLKFERVENEYSRLKCMSFLVKHHVLRETKTIISEIGEYQQVVCCQVKFILQH